MIQPQIERERYLTEEAYEDACALAEALRYHAERPAEALMTVAELAELDEQRAA